MNADIAFLCLSAFGSVLLACLIVWAILRREYRAALKDQDKTVP